jgi:hypothetical protein
MKLILWLVLAPFLPLRWLYRAAVIRNDINAIRRHRVGRRIGRRLYGKASGRLARSLFG